MSQFKRIEVSCTETTVDYRIEGQDPDVIYTMTKERWRVESLRETMRDVYKVPNSLLDDFAYAIIKHRDAP